MRLKNFRAILLALLLMMLIPLASAAPATTSIDTNSVSIEEATNVADFYKEEISGSITGYAGWKGAIVQKATTYYDLNGKVSAYSFDVFVKNQYAGYLIISATRDNYPLLEFSKGKTPDSELSTRTESRELAAVDAKSRQATLGEGRPLYLGATFYYMEYPIEMTSGIKSTSHQDQDRILVDLYEKKIIDPEMNTVSTGKATAAELNSLQNEADKIINEASIREFNTQKKKEAQKEWNMIEKAGILKSQDIESSVSKSYISEKTIQGVPNFEWRWGCSPTSAAMVVGYWRDLGLTRLPNDDEISPDNKLCGDPLNGVLATEMGTESNGETWPWMIAYGINRVVAVGSGYSYTSGSELVTAYSWPNIQNEIDSERPFVLSMSWAGEPIYAFGHSVAAVGYGYDSWYSSKYIQIHDTWDNTTEPYIRFGNWVGAMNSYMRPDYTYTITSSAGTHGAIFPSGTVQVPTGTWQNYTITPDSGYMIDELLVDGSAIEASTDYTFSDVTADHTISATFKEELQPIVPLCPAGTPFDASEYPQNHPESDPMTFGCNWDGNGQVYISGEPSELTGVWADDGFTITIQPSGQIFDATPHRASQHNILELTTGMTPGTNTFTLIVKNWCGLSMSYGSSTGIGTDQTPYIIQVNSKDLISKAIDSHAEELPSFIKQTDDGLVVNGTLV
ncbi:MAG: C39 family peptidase [Methanomicrobiaceae archaeon]|nr:C39 family peptidase [Methanomicrobiaceae archaeon]